MSPKEKAQELIDKFNDVEDLKGRKIIYFIIDAKQCALIAVDEIMKAPHENEYIELIPSDADDTDWFWDKFDEYWQEVKKEIKKL